MNKVYLKFPTIEDREKWIEYIKEYCSDDSNAKPLSCTKDLNYEKWMEQITGEHNSKDLFKGRIPSSVYFLMDGDKIVGHLSIKHNINNYFLSLYGGHIGCGVRPSERRKGYASIMLHLALEKCKDLGLENVMVTCREDNIGSAKTIENNFGILKEVIYIPEENCNFKKYWINVKEALKGTSSKRNDFIYEQ